MGRRNLFRTLLVILIIMTFCMGCKVSHIDGIINKENEQFTQYMFDYKLAEDKTVPIELKINQGKCYVEIGVPLIESLYVINRGKYDINLLSLPFDNEIFKFDEATGECELLFESTSYKYGPYSTEGVYFFKKIYSIFELSIYPIEGSYDSWPYNTCIRGGYMLPPGKSVLLQYVLVFMKEGRWLLEYSINDCKFKREIITTVW